MIRRPPRSTLTDPSFPTRRSSDLIGQGQRVGIIAGSGVGKSVLLGMIVRAAEADVVVIGLIGERSREVADFLETKVAGAARQRSVVVAVPANHSPVLRIRGDRKSTRLNSSH